MYPAYAPEYAPANELTDLRQQADAVKNTLDAIKSRIAELEGA
jgi:hypothetical protein